MVYSIQITQEAYEDLEAARDYFNGQRPGLGSEFLDEFEAVLKPLEVHPKLYSTVRGDIRRGVLQRFPYIFVYTVEDKLITILRVIHTGGNTEYYSSI
ncbi:MAG: type II toxin-antitoxin system RelE/ParE family toxin [Phaeodactylibacter sp.]|nr:type II toxin-antitoxin system RelE/ParE family toxin [Phaeodactylibacter sp.]